MKKPKMTPWFSGAERPARDGVYERRARLRNGHMSSSVVGFAKWIHGGWNYSRETVERAERDYGNESSYQPDRDSGLDFEWRGLAKEPKQ